jgi:sugar phosphate isomerase/epimerase
MTQFSFATSCLDNSGSVRYAVEFAIEHGFSGVEINAPSIFLSELIKADRDWMLAMAGEHNLRYTFHFPPSALPGSFDATTRVRDLASLVDEIRVAGELGVETIVLHPGRLDVPGVEQVDVSEADRAVAISFFVDFVKAAAPVAEGSGVVIGLENMHYIPGWVIRSHRELAESVDTINSPAVGITFDVGHAWGSGGVDAGIEVLGDRIKHVQVHDARGPEGAGNVRDQHKEIGTGLIDWSAGGVVAALVGAESDSQAQAGSSSNGFIVALETSGRDQDREAISVRSRDLLQGLWG